MLIRCTKSNASSGIDNVDSHIIISPDCSHLSHVFNCAINFWVVKIYIFLKQNIYREREREIEREREMERERYIYI